MRAALRAVSASGIALVLAGCLSGLHSSAPVVQSYVLSAAPPAAATPSADAAPSGDATPQQAARPPGPTLQVERPIAAPGLDTDQIAVLQSEQRLSSYVASRWAVALPELIESLTVQTLRDTREWQSVEGSHTVFPAQYRLQLTIRHFEADYSAGKGPPLVHVQLEVMIQRRADRELIGSFDVERTERAAEDRLAPVVAAFQRATTAALAATARGVRDSLRTATVPSPPSGDSASN